MLVLLKISKIFLLLLLYVSVVTADQCRLPAFGNISFAFETCSSCIVHPPNNGMRSWCSNPGFCFHTGDTNCEAECDGVYFTSANGVQPCGEYEDIAAMSGYASIAYTIFTISYYVIGAISLIYCCCISKTTAQLQAENVANAAAYAAANGIQPQQSAFPSSLLPAFASAVTPNQVFYPSVEMKPMQHAYAPLATDPQDVEVAVAYEI